MEDEEDMANSSVLVSGIADNTTEDALYNYFENTRRSNGGEVKEIKRRGNGEAVVTFESPDTAKRVLEWAKHVLDNNLLTLKRPEPPKSATSFTTEEPSTTEEKSRTILVTGISPKTTKDALLNLFENRRRSGGGEVEDIQYNEDEGSAEITFCTSEDAENVSMQENLALDGSNLGIALKEIPIILPKDPYKLHISGLSDKTTKDCFQSYIEVASGEEVKSMLFGNDSNVMVTFEEPPDFGKVQTKCNKRPLDGSHLQVEQVSICNCVEVSGLGSKTTHDTVLFYFENSKNGGDDVKKVEYTDGEAKALVFFEEPSAVDKVLAKGEHVINKKELKVVPHYPFLGEASEEPEGKKQKHLTANKQEMAFIEKFFHDEFSGILQEHEMKFTQHQDEAVVESINTKIDKAKWDQSCDTIKSYIGNIKTHAIKVPSTALKETIQQAKQRFNLDKIYFVYNKDKQQIVLRGKMQDVDELAVQLDDLSKEIDRKIQYENAKVTEMIEVSKPQLDLLTFTAEIERLRKDFKDLVVNVDIDQLAIHIIGPDPVVKKVNRSIWKYLAKIKDQEIELSRYVVNIVNSTAGKVYLSKQFKGQNIEAVIASSDGNDDTLLLVTAVDRNDLRKAIDLIKDVFIEENVFLDPDQSSVVSSDEWKQLDGKFKKCMLLNVTVDTASNIIYIAGKKDEVHSAKERILTFLEENTIIDKTIEADQACTEYVLRFQKDEVRKIQENLLVDIRSGSEEGFVIRGTKQGIDTATTKFLLLVNQVKHKTVDIKKPGMKKFLNYEKGKELLSLIENEQACIIKQCSPLNDKKMNYAAVDVTVGGGSQAKQICNYVTPEGKNITILKGDMTEVNVDVMVNAANGKMQHIEGLARAIVDKGGKEIQDECDEYISRHNDLLDGAVFVSSPGKLPCKRLVHVVGPRWNRMSNTYGDDEAKEERLLAQAVFNALEEAKKFSSIAIPAISSGICGFPIELCAKTILESLLVFSKENASAQLSEIYIIDTKDDVMKAFYSEMKSRFGKEKSFTDRYSSHFHKYSFETVGRKFSHHPLSLKIFAYGDSVLKKAETAINGLLKDQYQQKLIDKPQSAAAIKGLSESQKARILKLQEKYLTEIEIQKHASRIIVQGLSDDVKETILAIHKILTEKTSKEHERKDAELVSKTVQLYFTDNGKREAYGGKVAVHREELGKVARRVESRQHHLNGCKLTFSNEDKEYMATNSVLVSGIADNTNDDALYNYFENTRRSSGGDVKDIKRLGNGQAVVTFESPDTAKRVLDRAKHVLDNNLLTLKRSESPKSATSLTTEEPSMTEEKSRTIRVTGISPKTTKDALLYLFENRRSGGGDVEDIQYNEDEGFAEITFCSSEDAENVSKQEYMALDGSNLGITLKELPIILPKDPCKLYLRGLSDKTTKDYFQSYIEVVSGEEVQSMLFGNDSNVMVTFEDPPDVGKVQTKCNKRPLDGNHLQVEQVSICNCVEVSGLGLKTTHITILYYFENPRCGGGDVKKVEYTDGETKALVFFEEPSVVDRVVARRHVINKDVVKVVPYYPLLGEASEEPAGGKTCKKWLSFKGSSIKNFQAF